MTGEMTFSANDRRVLRAVVHSSKGKFEGYAPHGSRDWAAIRRLVAWGLVEDVGAGWCETCPEGHDVRVYVLTEQGRGSAKEKETPTHVVALPDMRLFCPRCGGRTYPLFQKKAFLREDADLRQIFIEEHAGCTSQDPSQSLAEMLGMAQEWGQA